MEARIIVNSLKNLIPLSRPVTTEMVANIVIIALSMSWIWIEFSMRVWMELVRIWKLSRKKILTQTMEIIKVADVRKTMGLNAFEDD